jgi:hypothetical protein
VIRHVVFFKFKPEASAEERKSALDALRDLPRKIDVIREFEVGDNIIPSPRAWDAVLLARYDSLDSLQEYSVHHEHVAVAARLKAICENIGSVDYEEEARSE